MEPKPPPTSGAITRTLCSGMPSTKAVMSSRCTWGFCEVTQSVQIAGGVLVAGHAGARLHGVGHQPLVHDALLHDRRPPSEGGIGRRRVADLPLEGDVAGRDLVDLRLRPTAPRARCSSPRAGRSQSTVDQLGGVARRGLALRDHDGHRDRPRSGRRRRPGACAAADLATLGEQPWTRSGSELTPVMSLPVKIATTPGRPWRSAMSILRILRAGVRAAHEGGVGHRRAACRSSV